MAAFNTAATGFASSTGRRAVKNSVSQSRERGEMVRGDAASPQHVREPPHVIDEGPEDSELQGGPEELQMVANIFPTRRAATLPEPLVGGRGGLVEPVDDRLDGLIVQGEEASQALRCRYRRLFLAMVHPSVRDVLKEFDRDAPEHQLQPLGNPGVRLMVNMTVVPDAETLFIGPEGDQADFLRGIPWDS